jgi:hypothetical protein
MVAAPVGAGDLGQLEALADIACAPHMRAAAEVDPIALGVEGDRLRDRQILDELGLVALALGLEEGDGLVPVPDLAREGGIAGDDLPHAGLDRRQILQREGLVAGEVIIKAVLDRGADRHLRAGEQRLHRLRQYMGGVVADHLQRLGILPRDEGDRGVLFDRARQIDELAVELHGEGSAGEAGPDVGRHRGAGDGAREVSHGAVRQGDGGHGSSLG